MTQARRTAPDPEWVLMYRRGIPTPKIAAVAGVAETTVRYHLAVAARQDPGIRAEHQAALTVPVRRLTAAGQRNLVEILDLYTQEARLPRKSVSAREAALFMWLHYRRREAAQGTLSPACAQALDAIPGWRTPPSRKADDEARWKRRLDGLAEYRSAGNDWPRHAKTSDQNERALGVWLHTQRINDRAGTLDPARRKQLDTVIPGWRQGRPRRRANSRTADQRIMSGAGGISGQL
jgi:hypothetical protein